MTKQEKMNVIDTVVKDVSKKIEEILPSNCPECGLQSDVINEEIEMVILHAFYKHGMTSK
jgi:hypothetical protein